jgi:hypothetical protein
MPKTLFCIFIFSISTAFISQAQLLRLTQIRVGFDPIYTATQFTKTIYTQNSFLNYKNWEANIEFIGPYRLSMLAEVGKTGFVTSPGDGSFYTNNYGFYSRYGFNFDLAKPSKNFEYDLGWRLGYSNSFMDNVANLKGDYWGGYDNKLISQFNSQTFWVEVLLDTKARLFTKQKGPLGNIWAGISIRGKIMPFFTEEAQTAHVSYVPGYGYFLPFGGGIQFNLLYAFHLLGPNVHKCKHVHDNVDFIENKSHKYKIRRHTLDGDELDRD